MGRDRNVHIKSYPKTTEFESAILCIVSLQSIVLKCDLRDFAEYRYVQSAKNALETAVRKSEPVMCVQHVVRNHLCLG